MTYRTILATVVALALFASCKNTPSGNDGLDLKNFDLRITVRNSAGNPVPGLRVSAWNIEPWPAYSKPAGISLSRTTSASTTLGFDVPATAKVSLSIFDLDNTEVERLTDRRLMMAGTFRITATLSGQVGTRVYKCRMIAQDASSNAQVFADSVYMVLWQPDASIAILGTTSASGQVETNDSLRFPNVLSLPGLVRTDFDPTSLEVFAIPDSVVFAVTDTVTGNSQSFRRVVGKGFNDIQLVWNPSQAGRPVSLTRFDRPQGNIPRDSVSVPTEWKLYQNYPNPFN